MQATTVQLPLDQPPQATFFSNGTYGPASHATYCLPSLWAIHYYNYAGRVQFDAGPWRELRPGCVSLTPPGVVSHYQWPQPECTHACAHFSLPPGAAAQPLAPVIDLGPEFASAHDRMQSAIVLFPTVPRHAEAILWELLWQLASHYRTRLAPLAEHPAVTTAVGFIERHMADSGLRVQDVARHCRLSHNQLTRLFGQQRQTTVVAYLQQRRVERAQRLLRDTDLPIKAVAISVGMPDLQQFNKLIRRHTGLAPRTWRTHLPTHPAPALCNLAAKPAS